MAARTAIAKMDSDANQHQSYHAKDESKDRHNLSLADLTANTKDS